MSFYNLGAGLPVTSAQNDHAQNLQKAKELLGDMDQGPSSRNVTRKSNIESLKAEISNLRMAMVDVQRGCELSAQRLEQERNAIRSKQDHAQKLRVQIEETKAVEEQLLAEIEHVKNSLNSVEEATQMVKDNVTVQQELYCKNRTAFIAYLEEQNAKVEELQNESTQAPKQGSKRPSCQGVDDHDTTPFTCEKCGKEIVDGNENASPN